MQHLILLLLRTFHASSSSGYCLLLLCFSLLTSKLVCTLLKDTRELGHNRWRVDTLTKMHRCCGLKIVLLRIACDLILMLVPFLLCHLLVTPLFLFQSQVRLALLTTASALLGRVVNDALDLRTNALVELTHSLTFSDRSNLHLLLFLLRVRRSSVVIYCRCAHDILLHGIVAQHPTTTFLRALGLCGWQVIRRLFLAIVTFSLEKRVALLELPLGTYSPHDNETELLCHFGIDWAVLDLSV